MHFLVFIVTFIKLLRSEGRTVFDVNWILTITGVGLYTLLRASH